MSPHQGKKRRGPKSLQRKAVTVKTEIPKGIGLFRVSGEGGETMRQCLEKVKEKYQKAEFYN